jgi:hypothetical protein
VESKAYLKGSGVAREHRYLATPDGVFLATAATTAAATGKTKQKRKRNEDIRGVIDND